MRLNFSPDAPDGGTTPATPEPGQSQPPQTAEQINRPQTGEVVTAPGAPPPAAVVVANGTITERDAELQRQLDEERQARIDRERRINDLEDENHRLKQIPATKPTKKKSIFPTLLHEEED